MVDGTWVPLGYAPLLLAGVTLLILAILVFAGRPDRPLNRAFAVFLVCHGLFFFLLGLHGSADSLSDRLREYAAIGVPFSAAYVAFQVLTCYRAARVPRAAQWAVLLLLSGAAAAFVWLFIAHRELYQVAVPAGYAPGPLDIFVELSMLTFAGLAVLFCIGLRHSDLSVARRSLGQAMTAFALVPAYITGWLLSGDVLNLAAGWDTLGNEVADGRAWALLAAGAIAAVPILLLRSDRDVGLQEIAARHRGLLAVAAVAGLVGGTVFALGQGNRAFHDAWPAYFLVHFGLYGMTALLAAVMLLVPVLRDHVLDVEFKVQLTIRNGFVATTLGGVLLVAVQVGANMLSQAAGFTMGGVLAVGLLLCLGPVAHLGERLARRTMPSPGPLSRMPEQDRARIYQEQAQLVWADGRLNAKERRFLDGLARKLGLAAAEAHTLERSAIGQ